MATDWQLKGKGFAYGRRRNEEKAETVQDPIPHAHFPPFVDREEATKDVVDETPPEVNDDGTDY